MKIAYLKRVRKADHGTGGELVLKDLRTDKDLVLFTVERPWLDNKPFVSCIPTGTYTVKKRDGSNQDLKYPDAWEVLDVKHRWGILFHVANTPIDVVGCIGPNRALKIDANTIRGYHSRVAVDDMDKFLSDAGVSEFTLIIE